MLSSDKRKWIMENIQFDTSKYDIPMYSAAEASRLVGLSATRVRRWLKGYKYSYENQIHQQSPIIHRQDLQDSYASFLNLIELLFVKRFVDYGISLQKVRKALDEASEIVGTKHFAHQCFFTSGNVIYLKVKEQGNAILQLLSGGQWVIPSIIQQLAYQIVFDDFTSLARRWYPMGTDGLIVLDPYISFGRPSIVSRGIATSNIFDFYMAENKSMKRLCSWMNLTPQEAKAAVNFEEYLAA